MAKTSPVVGVAVIGVLLLGAVAAGLDARHQQALFETDVRVICAAEPISVHTATHQGLSFTNVDFWQARQPQSRRAQTMVELALRLPEGERMAALSSQLSTEQREHCSLIERAAALARPKKLHCDPGPCDSARDTY